MFKLFKKNDARKVIIPSDYGDTKRVYTFDRENLKGYFPIVMDMIQALKTKYPNIDTSIFEERVKSLTFYDMTCIRKIADKILPQGVLRSNYNVVNNEIKVYDNADFLSVYKLLLTCASFRRDEAGAYSGLTFFENKGKIHNVAIGDGYRALLCEKMFDKRSDSYAKLISECAEYLIGEEEMMNLFFKADFKNFVLKMEEFDPSFVNAMGAIDELNESFAINKMLVSESEVRAVNSYFKELISKKSASGSEEDKAKASELIGRLDDYLESVKDINKMKEFKLMQ